jgi:hypothetical protein
VRRFASTDVPEPPDSTANIPPYWIRPPQTLSTAAGMHRFIWDLRYSDPEVPEYGYPISAIYQYTPREPRGPFVVPGTYTVTLTAGDVRSKQPLVVKMDPRVPVTAVALGQQLATATRLTAALHTANATLQQLRALRPRSAPADSLAAGLNRLARQLAGVYDQVAGADVAPRPVVLTAVADLERTLAALQRRWRTLQRAP